MPGPVQRVGDTNIMGGTIITGDPTVLVNGRPVATLGEVVTPHFCCGVPHCPPIHCFAQTTSTNPTVLVNGYPSVPQAILTLVLIVDLAVVLM